METAEMRRSICLIAILLGLGGCQTKPSAPDLGGLYNEAASHHDERRNPVIVIPGILGSKLKDGESGRVAWGAFSGTYISPETPEGARLAAVPMQKGTPLKELNDGIVSDGALDRVKLNVLGLPLQLNAYANILCTLGVGGYRDSQLGDAGAIDYGDGHYTCFQFDYDWRRDNVENARRLHEFMIEKRAYVREEIRKRYGVQREDVKFDIVAHSMGGLIARYYLQYGDADLPEDGSIPAVTWRGRELVDKVVLVGTPSAGSVQALLQLVNGFQPAPILPKYEPAVLGTMPSIYQLLPRTRHRAAIQSDTRASLDVYDINVWEEMNWGLLSPGQDHVLRELLPEVTDAEERRSIAHDHLVKCLARAQQFTEAMDQPVDYPEGLQLYLVAGDAAETAAVVAVDPGTHRLSVISKSFGDGTVLRSSALMDERTGGDWSPHLRSPIRWTHATFLFTDHLGMTKDAAFADNVLFILLEQP